MPQINTGAGMGRQDVDLLINNQNGIISSVREVRYNFQIFWQIYVLVKIVIIIKTFFFFIIKKK